MAASGPRIPKPSSRSFATVQISTGATGISDSINVTGLTLSSIQMSTAWTDAGIGFAGNVDGSTNYYDVYNTDGTFTVFQTSASRIVSFNPAQFDGIQNLQVISRTTAGTAVAQGATRTIVLGLSEVVNAD